MFNLPYSKNVKTGIGKTFLKSIKKHFPRDHRLYVIFNRNELKLRYMSSVIEQHNCNYQEKMWIDYAIAETKTTVLFIGKCLQTCFFYEADVITNKYSPIYYGASDGEFKSRHNNHTISFCYRNYKQYTKLSKCICQL